MRHRSVDQRSLRVVATDGNARTLGLKPIAHFSTYQPLNWKMRGTESLFSPGSVNIDPAFAKFCLRAVSLLAALSMLKHALIS